MLYYSSTGRSTIICFSSEQTDTADPILLNNSVVSIVYVQYSIPMKQLTMVSLKAVSFLYTSTHILCFYIVKLVFNYIKQQLQ